MGLFILEKSEEIKSKSDSESIQHRDIGNKFYSQNRIFQALISYNKALNYAKSEENLALAYGNRSAAYLAVKMYQKSIHNIEMAKAHNYPSEKMSKLEIREKNCKIELERSNRESSVAKNFFKLSHAANKKIPWIVDCVEMRKSEKFGRGIYAKVDLKAGEIICVEDLHLNISTSPDSGYKHCANCFKTSKLNLLPCLKQASMMFCTSGCRDEFYKHANLTEKDFDKISTILSQIQSAFGGQKQLEGFMKSNKIGEKSIFDFDFSDPEENPEFLKNIFVCFFSLSQTLAGAPYLLDDRHDFSTRQILCNILGILQNNSIISGHFNLDVFYSGTPGRHPQIYDALSFSTFYSLLNHSCLPNVKHTTIDNQAIIYVKKPIKAGEQLFVSYTGEFFEKNIFQRKLLLEARKVDCDCRGCLNNLTFDDLKPRNPARPYRSMVEASKLETVKDGIAKIKKIFEMINKMKGIMCYDYAIAEANVAILLQMIAFQLMFPV